MYRFNLSLSLYFSVAHTLSAEWNWCTYVLIVRTDWHHSMSAVYMSLRQIDIVKDGLSLKIKKIHIYEQPQITNEIMPLWKI